MLKLPFSSPNNIKVGPCKPYNYCSFVNSERPHSAPCKHKHNTVPSSSWDSGDKPLQTSPSLHQQDKENDWHLRSSPLPLTPLTSDSAACYFSGSPRELQLVVDDNGRADMHEGSPSYETDQYLNLDSVGDTISSVDITALDSPGYSRKCPSVANCDICSQTFLKRDDDGSAEQAMLKSLGVVPSEIFRPISDENSSISTATFNLSIDRGTSFFSNTRVTESDEDIFSFGSLSKRRYLSSSDGLLSSDIQPENVWYQMRGENTLSPSDEDENGSDSDHIEANIDTITPSELEIYPTKCGSETESPDLSIVENEFDHQRRLDKNMKTEGSSKRVNKSATQNRKRKRNIHGFSLKNQATGETSRLGLINALLQKYPHTKGSISGVLCCKFSYSNATELAGHLDEMHEEEFRQKYLCHEPQCVYSVLGFTSKQELSRHISSAHSPPRYYCDICFTHGHERTFRRSDTLKRHIKAAHSSDKGE